jgi:hypothetical protein
VRLHDQDLRRCSRKAQSVSHCESIEGVATNSLHHREAACPGLHYLKATLKHRMIRNCCVVLMIDISSVLYVHQKNYRRVSTQVLFCAQKLGGF